MASVFIDDYHIYYECGEGKILEFEKMDINKGITVMSNKGVPYKVHEWNPVDSEEELIMISERLIKLISKDKTFHGYPAFIYKLEEEGKISIPS